MKLVKYFLQKKAVTILLLVLILAGGLFSYIKMGKLEDAPFTIKQVNPEKPDVPLNKNDAFQKVQKRHVQEKR